MSRPCVCRVYSLDVSAVIELCKTAFGGFTVALADVLSGFLHGSDDHVKADISGAAEEVRKVDCVHCAFCGHGIALNADFTVNFAARPLGVLILQLLSLAGLLHFIPLFTSSAVPR